MSVQTATTQPPPSNNPKKKNKNKPMKSGSNNNTATTPASDKKEPAANAPVAAKKGIDSRVIEEHLPPLGLVLTVIFCSGSLFVFGLRDVLATGKALLPGMDDSLQRFTKSDFFFDDEHGWRSQAGGLSTILQYSTDHNNMGGLYVRKMCGVAVAGVHLQKLWPLLFHPVVSMTQAYQNTNYHNKHPAQWKRFHFQPLYTVALWGNIATIAFYVSYLDDLYANNVTAYPQLVIGVLFLETLVMLYYVMSNYYNNKHNKKTKAKTKATITTTTTDKKTDETITTTTTTNTSTKTTASSSSSFVYPLPAGKTSRSVINRIVTRTVCIVTSLIALLALRDLFWPSLILKRVIPRDDIYLEWTNSLLHSPPPDSPEYLDDGGSMEAGLYIGDKFVSQKYALHLLILSAYKYVSAVWIRYGNGGNDGGVGGTISATMIWRVQALVNGGFLFLVRLFTPAAATASLDLRWHLMFLAYETFILGIYGFL